MQIFPPAAPANLAAAASGTTIVLTWQDNSTDESQYYIERCQGSGCTNFMGYGASGANSSSVTDYSVTPGVSYSYRVRAWNLGGYSGFSKVTSAATSGALLSAAPASLTTKALSRTSVKLTWVTRQPTRMGS